MPTAYDKEEHVTSNLYDKMQWTCAIEKLHGKHCESVGMCAANCIAVYKEWATPNVTILFIPFCDNTHANDNIENNNENTKLYAQKIHNEDEDEDEDENS